MDDDPLRVAVFHADVTPPVGHPLCAGWYPPAVRVRDPLHARGLVLAGGGQAPVVLCVLDWAELSNGDHRRWRDALARAAGTHPDRVAVHCTHVHDAPWPDRDAQDLCDAAGYPDVLQAGDWAERARDAVAAALAAAPFDLCTHVSAGQAPVVAVASNRRVLGDDGRVRAVRWTYTRDPEVRAAPEGSVDPWLKSVGLWNGERALAWIHAYAVHPTSVDGTGEVTCEFVGLARERRIREDGGVPHLYWTGCAGDVTAGKYNDGTLESRARFADRILEAMRASERDAAARRPLERFSWSVVPVRLPPREDLDPQALRAVVADPRSQGKIRSRAALMAAYLDRADIPIPVTALHLNGDVVFLHLPAEAFVAYQFDAQAARPDAFVAVAAYGDCGPGYVTREGAAAAGGYEPVDAFVSERSEPILRAAIAAALAPTSPPSRPDAP